MGKADRNKIVGGIFVAIFLILVLIMSYNAGRWYNEAQASSEDCNQYYQKAVENSHSVASNPNWSIAYSLIYKNCVDLAKQ